MTSRRRILHTTGVVCSFGLAGCSGILGGGSSGDNVPLDEVDVRLVDVRRPEAGVTTATVPILVGFSNPTSVEISGLSGDLDIFIHGTRVGSEDVSISRLAPGEESIQELSIIVEYSELSGSIVESIQAGSLEVRIEGELRASGEVEQFSLSSSDERQ